MYKPYTNDQLLDVLTRGREIIAKHDHCKETFFSLGLDARDSISQLDDDVRSVCTMGGIIGALGEDALHPIRAREIVEQVLAPHIPADQTNPRGYLSDVCAWNNRADVGKEDVLDLYDRAISQLRAEVTS